MAEFCKKCFIRMNKSSEEEIKRIVLSNYNDLCEGCGSIKPIVLYIDHSDERNKKK